MGLLSVAIEKGITAASTASTGLSEIASAASTGLGEIAGAAGVAVGATSWDEAVPSLMLEDSVQLCDPGPSSLHELFHRGAQVCRELCQDEAGVVVVHPYGQPSLMLGDSFQLCHPGALSLHEPLSFFESSIFYSAQVCQTLCQDVSSCLPSYTGYLAPFATHVAPALSISAGVYCALRYYCVVGSDDDVADDDYAGTPPTDTSRFVAPCMKALGFADCFLAGVVVHSYGQPFLVPLKTYAIGSLLLGFPTTYLVNKVAKGFGIRRGFLLDALLAAVAFVWLCTGTAILAESPPDVMNQSPLLFWTLFIQAGFAWTAASSSVITLMSSAAASAIRC